MEQILITRGHQKCYIPGVRSLFLVPSCFCIASNTTVRAGMFTPIANVSVANNSWKQYKRKRKIYRGTLHCPSTYLNKAFLKEQFNDLRIGSKKVWIMMYDCMQSKLYITHNLLIKLHVHTSFTIGRIPLWCTAIPLLRCSFIHTTCTSGTLSSTCTCTCTV